MPAILATAHPADPQQQARSRTWWFALGLLALAQLVAFWMLCSHQVRLAEARSNAAAVQQMALSDCLQYISGSTIASCTTQLGARGGPSAANAAVSGATPVSFVR